MGLWQWIGHGIDPPTLILIFYMITLVLTKFWLAIMWGGWPFVGWFKRPVAEVAEQMEGLTLAKATLARE